MAEKKKPSLSGLGDDSGEMEVIKEIFSSEEPTGGTTDIFASDLFAADPFALANPPEPKPEPKPTPRPPQTASPQAPSAPSGIKVVTDEDLKQLLTPSPAVPPPAKPQPVPEPKTSPPRAPAAEPESLDFQPVAEDFVAVGAAKTGPALEEVAQELEGLEPMGDDFMSIAEMKKLFQNVNQLIDTVQKFSRRLDEMEKALFDIGAIKANRKKS